MIKRIFSILLLICSFALTIQNSYAQTIPGKVIPLLKKLDTTKKDTVVKVVPKSPVKPYKEVITKEFTTQSGLFTVHKSYNKLYFEIPDSIFHRDIMVINRLNKGPGGINFYAGEELDENTIQFEKGADSTIRIRYTLVINEADSTSAIFKSVVQSSTNPIVASFPIIAYSKDNKSFVIDVTKMVKEKSLLNSINDASAITKSVSSYSMRDFILESVHVYPENVEITVSKNLDSKPTAGPALPLSIESHTSFIALPKIPLQRRYFDPRVGFFADAYYPFDDHQQKAQKKQFVLRWRLEPKDEDRARWEKGELVEPKKPIVIYIDPATPKQWRPYLIKGVNDWQVAFEKAGFKNAVIGKEWPENDTTMHMDDARYSMINYFPSEIANAYGPQVHDPRSGEIIQTRIGWYHNVMSILHDWYMVQAAAVDPRARKPKFDEDLMGELIRFVSSHEVGHTLGLRHNFGSSSQTPVDSLRSNKYLTAHGHTASIMDYARFNYVAQPEDHIEIKNIFPRIGEYDQWAIEWGYKTAGKANAEEDQKAMNALLVKKAANKRLWFGDGETKKLDPRNQMEDLGDNAALASRYGIRNLKRILPNLPQWTMGEGGVNDNLAQMYFMVQNQYFTYMGHVLRNIGGLRFDLKSEEQKGAMYAPTPKALQQQALEFFNAELFKTPYWLINKGLLSKAVPPTGKLDFISDTQAKVLNSLLDMERIAKLQSSVNQFGKKAYPVNEYIATIHRGIWSELAKQGPVKMDSYRRTLQKTYFGAIVLILTSKDPVGNENDGFSILKDDLNKLQREIKSAIPRVHDPLTLYHLKDLDGRIREIKNPRG